MRHIKFDKNWLIDKIKFLLAWIVFIIITGTIYHFLIDSAIVLSLFKPATGIFILPIILIIGFPVAVFSLSLSFYALFRNNWREKITTNILVFAAIIIEPITIFFLRPVFQFLYPLLVVGESLFVTLTLFILLTNMLFMAIQIQDFPPFSSLRWVYRGFFGSANKYLGTMTEDEFLSLARVLKSLGEPKITEINGRKTCFVWTVKSFLSSDYIPIVHLSFDKTLSKLTVYTMNYSGFHATPKYLDYFEPIFKKLSLVKEGIENFSEGVFRINKEHPKFSKWLPFYLILFLFNFIFWYLTKRYTTTRTFLPPQTSSLWQTTNTLIGTYPVISIVIALFLGYVLRDVPKLSELLTHIKEKIKEA